MGALESKATEGRALRAADLPRGTIKQRPEDFAVEEIPAYEPSGEGPHLYVRFRKTNVTTDDVVRAFARALGVDRRDVGVAGLKDKVGVTTQTISLPAEDRSIEERAASFAMDGVEILERRRHGNKLKTGHLKGNRFTIVVRDVDPARVVELQAALDAIGADGVPNAFGVQRFGRDGDNAERARAWLTGKERAPTDPRLRRFHFSALQSAIFNAVLDRRIEQGTWNVPVPGDLLRKEETGGIFVCTDVQQDRERAARGELCPTGPIVGDRMRQPEAEALELEQRIVAPLIEGIDLRRARALGEGTRRPLRLRVAELSHALFGSSVDEAGPSSGAESSPLACAIRVRFVLPKGAYATTVLSNVLTVADASRGARDPEQPLRNEEE
jgi:tRNA pseudouridine13 synthase